MVNFLGQLGNFANKLGSAVADVQMKNLAIDDPALYSEIQQQKTLGDIRREELEMRRADRAMQMENLRRQRDAQAQMQAALGSIAPSIAQRTGLPADQVAGLAQAGGLGALGKLQDLMAAPEFDLQSSAEKALLKQNQGLTLSPTEQAAIDSFRNITELKKPPGTTVNVGGSQDPFASKFSEERAKGLAKQVGDLNVRAQDVLSEATGAERALDILASNPDIDISPTAELSANAKSLFAPILSEDQLQNVADFQELNSQLTRNRFNVTKVLKGAITEKEQQAAQIVAGRTTGTRQGLRQTLINNVATATLEADYNQRRAQYIQEMGANYKPAEFDKYYKEFGETGQRPTLDSIYEEVNQRYAPAAQPQSRTTAGGITYTVVQ